MSWWNAKYTNKDGEYEITFASKEYEKEKAVEKVCCAVMDRAVKSPMDVEVVVRCRECKHYKTGVCLKIYYDGLASRYAWQVRKPDDFCSYGEKRRDKDGTT